MQLKSNIDWNEMFPHFKKELRDTLLLEAVTILSSRRVTNGHDKPARIVQRKALVEATTEKKQSHTNQYSRYWRKHGPGGKLARAGRSYSINRNAKSPPIKKGTKLIKIWNVLLRNGADSFTFEAFIDLCNNAGLDGNATLSQLWSKGCIEVVPDAPAKSK